MKVIVIIPAAGLGSRMAPAAAAKAAKKTQSSKQFTELAGTPILIHTLRKFAAVDPVSEIWVVLRENEIEGFRERLKAEATDLLKKKIHFVTGGEHRQQSVENALNALSAAPDDIVLVRQEIWSGDRRPSRGGHGQAG
jgi:2-C-methyl-D-erythritol 4-phosphate cytidylyltransferase